MDGHLEGGSGRPGESPGGGRDRLRGLRAELCARLARPAGWPGLSLWPPPARPPGCAPAPRSLQLPPPPPAALGATWAAGSHWAGALGWPRAGSPPRRLGPRSAPRGMRDPRKRPPEALGGQETLGRSPRVGVGWSPRQGQGTGSAPAAGTGGAGAQRASRAHSWRSWWTRALWGPSRRKGRLGEQMPAKGPLVIKRVCGGGRGAEHIPEGPAEASSLCQMLGL